MVGFRDDRWPKYFLFEKGQVLLGSTKGKAMEIDRCISMDISPFVAPKNRDFQFPPSRVLMISSRKWPGRRAW